jgi:hypothetical protein
MRLKSRTPVEARFGASVRSTVWAFLLNIGDHRRFHVGVTVARFRLA